MDSSQSSSNDSQSEDEKELDTKDWPITENEEKKFWDEHILDKYIRTFKF